MAASMTLHELQKSLADCQRCRLASGRTQVVFGTGNPQATVMFVGEAPGFYEDKQGEPFVGAAGKLLNELLASIGLSRSDIYIANVIKCRPPNNRDPQPDEVNTCKPFLLDQIQFIRPHLVCTLGNFATQTLLNTKVGISKVRGRAIHLQDFVVFPLFHPAAALHQGNLKSSLVEDFHKLKDVLESMKQEPTESSLSQSPSRPQDQSEPEDGSTNPDESVLNPAGFRKGEKFLENRWKGKKRQKVILEKWGGFSSWSLEIRLFVLPLQAGLLPLPFLLPPDLLRVLQTT